MENLWASKCKNGTKNICIIFINDVFSTYDVLMWNTYILHFLWNTCNNCDVISHKIMGILCVKHEHLHTSFKNNVSFIWLFKILDTYKYCSY
jgi:hypothetical protein